MQTVRKQIHLRAAHWLVLEQWAMKQGVLTPSLAIEKLINEQLLKMKEGPGYGHNYKGSH